MPGNCEFRERKSNQKEMIDYQVSSISHTHQPKKKNSKRKRGGKFEGLLFSLFKATLQ